MRASSFIFSAVGVVRLGLAMVLAAFVAAGPASAGSTCTVSVVGGEDQLAIPGSRFSLPLQVQYAANATGPPQIDVVFRNCNLDVVRLHPTSPETGGFQAVVPAVPDGGIVEMLASIDGGETSSFAEVCVDITDNNGCTANTSFSFEIQPLNLDSPDPNPVIFVGQSVPLEVVVSPGQPDRRIRWELESGPAFLLESETFTDSIGHTSNEVFGTSPGTALVKAWIAHPGLVAPRGTGNTLGRVDFVVGIVERIIEILSGNNQSAPSNTQVAQPLRVRAVIDDGVNVTPEPGLQVSFSIKADATGGAVLVDHATGTIVGDGSSVVMVTDPVGQAQVGLRMGPGTGNVQVCASDVEGIGSGGCFDVTGTAGAPPQLVILAGNNQTVGAFETFEPLLVGTSPPGLLEPGTPIDWQVLAGNATVDGQNFTTTEFDSNGFASVTPVAGAAPSLVSIRGIVSGFDPVDFTLNVDDAVSQQLVLVSGDSQVAPPGELFDQPLAVRAERDGQPVPGLTVRWQRIQGGGSIEPDGTSQVDRMTANDGVSSIVVRAPPQPGGTRFRADAEGFGTVFFDLAAGDGTEPPPGGTPVQVELIAGDNQRGAAGSLAAQPIVVRVTELDGNATPVVGQRIDWSVREGSATLLASSSVTDSEGRAQVRFRYGEPGEILIRGGIPNSTTLFVEARATSVQPNLALVSGDGQTAPVDSTLPLPLVVAAQLPVGQSSSLAGIEVRWFVDQGGGSLAESATLTNEDGAASNVLTLGPDPGPQRVRAEIVGTAPVFFEATAIGAPVSGAQLVIVSGDGQNLPTNNPSAPLVVEARDGAGNPIPGAHLFWTQGENSNLSLEFAQTTTAGDGRSSNRVRLLRPGTQSVRVALGDIGSEVSATFTVNGGIRNTAGLGDRERRAAERFDQVCERLLALESPTPTQADLIEVCRGLIDGSGPRPGEVRDAIREILPDEVLGAGRMGLQMTAAQFDNLKARLAALRGGVRGVSFGGLALRGDNGTLPLGFLDTLLFGAAPDDEVGADFSRWAFFMSGSFGRGEKRATEREAGFDFDNWSLTGGVDYRYSDSLVFGLAAGYNRSDSDIRGGTGTLGSKGYSLSLYSTWYRQESFYLDSVLTLGRNDFDLERSINFSITGPSGTANYAQAAQSSIDGSQIAFAVSAGRDFSRDAWTFGPYLRLQSARQKIDGFTETIALPGLGTGLAFSVDDRSLKSLSGAVGGKVNYAISTNWGVLLPHFQIEYQREFEDDEQDFVVRLLNDPGQTPFVLRSDPVDRSFLNLGVGLSAVFANGRSAFIFYERTSGLADQKRENLALGLRFEF